MRKPAFIEIAYLKTTPEFKIIERCSEDIAKKIVEHWCNIDNFEKLIIEIKTGECVKLLDCDRRVAALQALNYLTMLHRVTFGGTSR